MPIYIPFLWYHLYFGVMAIDSTKTLSKELSDNANFWFQATVLRNFLFFVKSTFAFFDICDIINIILSFEATLYNDPLYSLFKFLAQNVLLINYLSGTVSLRSASMITLSPLSFRSSSHTISSCFSFGTTFWGNCA